MVAHCSWMWSWSSRTHTIHTAILRSNTNEKIAIRINDFPSFVSCLCVRGIECIFSYFVYFAVASTDSNHCHIHALHCIHNTHARTNRDFDIHIYAHTNTKTNFVWVSVHKRLYDFIILWNILRDSRFSGNLPINLDQLVSGYIECNRHLNWTLIQLLEF